jgi:hypothetical protein
MITSGNTDLQHYLHYNLTNEDLLMALSGKQLYIRANSNWCTVTSNGLLTSKATGTFVPRASMLTGFTFDKDRQVHKSSLRTRIALPGFEPQVLLDKAAEEKTAKEAADLAAKEAADLTAKEAADLSAKPSNPSAVAGAPVSKYLSK